jgi:hypothetical protein
MGSDGMAVFAENVLQDLSVICQAVSLSPKVPFKNNNCRFEIHHIDLKVTSTTMKDRPISQVVLNLKSVERHSAFQV